MAPTSQADPTADPATVTYMREIGRVPLLTHKEEQECGILIERKKYFEENFRKALAPKYLRVTQGILGRLDVQKKLIVMIAGIVRMPKNPRLSDLANNQKFRKLVDLKQKDSTIKHIKTKAPPGNLRKTEHITRRIQSISRDTLCITPTIIEITGDCKLSEIRAFLKRTDCDEIIRPHVAHLEQEYVLFETDGNKAQDKLTESNMRLVVSIAKGFANRNIPLLDLAQEGSIGLIDASERYNHRLGWKFSTYATQWIRHRITKALAKQGRSIRIPENKHKMAREIYHTRNNLAQELGREPTDQETATKLSIDIELLQHIDQIDQNPDSLDDLLFEDDSTTKAERVISLDPGPDDMAINSMLKPDLHNALAHLNRQERKVLRMRYGLNDDVKCTFTEIAKLMHKEREQIREIEKSAIEKLRQNPEVVQILKEYL